jgi:hypothetical protein
MDTANKIENFGESYKYGVLVGETLGFGAFGMLHSISRSYRCDNIITRVYLIKYKYPDFEHNPHIKLIEGEGCFYEQVQQFDEPKEVIKDSILKRIKKFLF